jgi:lipid-A-disaccharide synthase
MIFMIAGEASGDLLGSLVLSALMEQKKDLDVIGIGGPLMRAQGLHPTSLTEELQIMGFTDIARNFPHLLKVFRKTLRAILHLNPEIVVTIDYPGFNLRLAKALRKRGFKGKICHIVCPSVWAWGKKRIQTLAKNYDLLLTLFPFEKPLFEKTSLHVETIGHPLTQAIPYEPSLDKNTIAFFPGSRLHEIERNLPFYLRLIQKLDPKFKPIISLSHEKYRPIIQKMAGSLPLLSPEEMKKQKPMLAVAKCGTIILELALRGIPTVVTYAMSFWDIALAKWLFRIHLPYYSLPNLILNRPLFPELIGPALTDQNLFKTVSSFLDSEDNQHLCRLECQELREKLRPEKDPSQRAASLILSLL